MNVLKFNMNDVLVVELDGECFVGELVFRNKAGTQFNLDNVRNLNTNEMLAGTQMFYTRETLSITPLKSETPEPLEEVESTLRRSNKVADGVKETIPPAAMRSNLSSSQFNKITAGIENMIYINQTDRRFHDAMHLLRKQDMFAVGISTDFKAFCSAVSLISICTVDQQVFMLDILSLGQVPSMLKTLLESRWPRKILHNCSIAAYILRVDCGVKLDGILDTMVAHVSQNGDKSLSYVGDCLTAHLSIPGTVFQENKFINWMERPLLAESRILAAQQVAFLPVLFTHLLHDRMLVAFNEQCLKLAEYYDSNEDEVEVAYQICSNSKVNTEPLKADAMVPCDVDLKSLQQLQISPNINGDEDEDDWEKEFK